MKRSLKEFINIVDGTTMINLRYEKIENKCLHHDDSSNKVKSIRPLSKTLQSKPHIGSKMADVVIALFCNEISRLIGDINRMESAVTKLNRFSVAFQA